MSTEDLKKVMDVEEARKIGVANMTEAQRTAF